MTFKEICNTAIGKFIPSRRGFERKCFDSDCEIGDYNLWDAQEKGYKKGLFKKKKKKIQFKICNTFWASLYVWSGSREEHLFKR